MSTLDPSKKTLYTCEILDGGIKPQYKVSSADNPEFTIIKDSSTGCWIDICKLIDVARGGVRENITVSGPERFGLCDHNVIRLLQSQPNADKCSKLESKND